MTQDRSQMRASDSDRQVAVDRLRVAHDEGRLSLHDYDERLQLAYQSVTYADIAQLFVDLPAPGHGGLATREPTAAAAVPVTRPAAGTPPVSRGLMADLPTWCKILWAIWLTVMTINLVVYTLVSVSNGGREYFWPMWLLVPGAVVFGLSTGAVLVVRGRRASAYRRSLEAARQEKVKIKTKDKRKRIDG